jgi:transposase
VHHAESVAREVAKEAVGLYYERVSHRVAQANKVMGLLKRWGIMAREKDFKGRGKEDREKLLAALGDSAECKLAAGHVRLLWRSYDEAVREEELLHREVVKLARQEQVVVRWEKIPGIGWIRGMTLLAYLDTPWRFKSRRKLWKYLGVGLMREHSGSGSAWVHVDRGASRVLKNVIIGAAESVIMHKCGELYRRYERWREGGQSFKNARRNVARDIATVCWAIWKNGRDYDERLIGGMPVPGEAEGGGL